MLLLISIIFESDEDVFEKKKKPMMFDYKEKDMRK